jgi:hypothetical protein
MKNEEIGYICKKKLLTVLPMVLMIKELSSVSLKPRTFNEFIDYTWDEIEGTFVKKTFWVLVHNQTTWKFLSIIFYS